MKRIIRFEFIMYAIASAMIFALAYMIIPTRELLIALNALFVGLVAVVTVVFFPLFIRTVKTKSFDRVSQLTIGIIFTWASLIVSRLLSVYVVAKGDGSSASQSFWAVFTIYLAINGAVLHVTAPGMFEDKLTFNRGLLVAGFSFGAIATAVTLLLQGS